MAFFTSLWKARIIEKYKWEYENEKINSILASNTEIPRKTIIQKWRIYRRDTKTRISRKFKKIFPDGSSVSNLYYYLKTDQTFANFILKGVVGFLGGIVLTYLCFMFFVFQLSISLIHATIMSSVIGVLLTLGLAFSYRIRCLVFLLIPQRIRCLVFLLIPQLFSRVGRYTLTCYALVLILTGPATNTFKNLEVLSESMACSQEQIKTNVRQINESMKKPLNTMKDTIKVMVETMKRITSRLNEIVSKISVLVTTIGDVIQSSISWLNSVADMCIKKVGTPYDYCMKAVNRGVLNCRRTLTRDFSWLCNASSAAKSACFTVKTYKSVCFVADYATTSFAATLQRKLRIFRNRINAMISINIQTQHTYTFSSNATESDSQVAAGIITELRNRADLLLTWLSWSSCVTSLFLLLIIFRAKYYQHMFETRSRFDNRYVTQELRELDFKRYIEGRETILPLNRREQAKYITVTTFRLVTTEKLYLTRSMVFMAITTFKLLIHIVADYSLYWVLMTIQYHGKLQTDMTPGPSDAGVQISGNGIVADLIRSIFDSLTVPLLSEAPSSKTCLPNPYLPDLQRYSHIAVLITLLWFFALFEPYGLRLRHVIMGHFRPERAKTRAVWLYNHILRTRGSFMKLARRKLHREYKYSDQVNLTFRHWLDSLLPCCCLRYFLGTLPKEPHCLLCNIEEDTNERDTELIRCETPKCPGVYCTRCYSDIGNLCTICLSPYDYGDMSDISLEKGSSDESSDRDSEDDRDHYDNAREIKSIKIDDEENERLIKKSTTRRKSKLVSASKENKNEDQDDTPLLWSNNQTHYKCFSDQNIKYCYNTLIDGIRHIPHCQKNNCNDKNYIRKTMHDFIHIQDSNNSKNVNNDHKDNLSLNLNSLLLMNKEVDRANNGIKLKKINMLHRKRKVRSNKEQSILRTVWGKLRFLKFVSDCVYKSNKYNIKTTGKYFHVSKINTQSNKLNKFKRKHYKSCFKRKIILKSKRRAFNLQMLVNGKKCVSCKLKNNECKNKGDAHTNKLTKNVESTNNPNTTNNKEIKIDPENKRTNNKNFQNMGKYKETEVINRNRRSQRVPKLLNALCSSCLINYMNNIAPSKQILKKKRYAVVSDNKANFKRRKKVTEEIKCECEKNRIAKQENLNSRNYRLSSYLVDHTFIKRLFSKDTLQDKIKRKDVLCDVAKSIIEIAKDNVNEREFLKAVHSTTVTSSKADNSEYGNNLKLHFDGLSTSIKSIKIKDIKLVVSERFLHLRIKNPLPMMRDLYYTLLAASSKNKRRKNENKKMETDADFEINKQTCTNATQYRDTKKDKSCSCMRLTKTNKEFGDSANLEEYSSELIESSVILSTISLSDDTKTKTDTTVCSRVTIDYEMSPRRVKPK